MRFSVCVSVSIFRLLTKEKDFHSSARSIVFHVSKILRCRHDDNRGAQNGSRDHEACTGVYTRFVCSTQDRKKKIETEERRRNLCILIIVLAEADLIKSKSRIAGAGVGDGLWNCQDAAAAARIREKSYACHSLGRVPQQNEFRISATERDGKVHSENKFRISLRHEYARGVQTLCKKKKKKNLKRKRWFQVKDDRSQPHNRVISGQTHAFEWTIAPMDGRTDGCTIDRFVGSLYIPP
jgi:hypothetical protein